GSYFACAAAATVQTYIFKTRFIILLVVSAEIAGIVVFRDVHTLIMKTSRHKKLVVRSFYIGCRTTRPDSLYRLLFNCFV
ncbi:MAG: hypothetical protein M1339_02060, partial [Bacteroidetes bacterium]|nr:hypothetical protein [Bacteroidota bacterium]